MGASVGGGAEAAPFGGGGWLGGREGGVSANGIQETSNKAGVCPHAIVGKPKGAPGRWSKLERYNGSMKTKKTP